MVDSVRNLNNDVQIEWTELYGNSTISKVISIFCLDNKIEYVKSNIFLNVVISDLQREIVNSNLLLFADDLNVHKIIMNEHSILQNNVIVLIRIK